jgi:hypothetical protein
MALRHPCCYLVPVGFGGYLREILTTRGFGLRLLAVESRYREQVRGGGWPYLLAVREGAGWKAAHMCRYGRSGYGITSG